MNQAVENPPAPTEEVVEEPPAPPEEVVEEPPAPPEEVVEEDDQHEVIEFFYKLLDKYVGPLDPTPRMSEQEEMYHTKLFTKEQIRVVEENRSKYRTKMIRIADLNSFMDCINYEMSLREIVRWRRVKYKIGKEGAIVESRIIERIKRLYISGLLRVSDYMPFFLSFLKFCSSINYVKPALDAVIDMIRHYPDDEQVWQAAAAWYAHDGKDIMTAEMTVIQGLNIHKGSRILYKEWIRVHLVRYDKSVSVNENSSRRDECVVKLEKIIIQITEKIKDVEFHLEILDLLGANQFTKDAREILMQCLMKDYPDNENVAQLRAKRADRYHRF